MRNVRCTARRELRGEGVFLASAEPPSRFMACRHVQHTEAKKGGSLAGASFSNSEKLLGKDFLKNPWREMRADRLLPVVGEHFRF